VGHLETSQTFNLREAALEGRAYMGSSLVRKRTPLGPYRRPMPGVLGGS